MKNDKNNTLVSSALSLEYLSLDIIFIELINPKRFVQCIVLNYKKNKLLIIYQLKRMYVCIYVCSQICSKQIVPLIRRMIDLTAAMRVIEMFQRK